MSDELTDEKALELLKSSADHGYIPAMYDYAQVTSSEEERIKYLKMAADCGFIPAEHELSIELLKADQNEVPKTTDEKSKVSFDDVNDIVHIKPNFFGFGIDVNEILKRLRKKR